MDNKDLQLYYEEQRAELVRINRTLLEVKRIFTDKVVIENLESRLIFPSEVTVKNQPETISINNLHKIEKALDNVSKNIIEALAKTSYKPLEQIEIKNIAEAKPKAVKINNLSDLSKYFESLAETISDNRPIINITKQDIVFPRGAKEAIPVRLSDGKSFYNAITSAFSSGSFASFKDINNNYTQVQLTAGGAVPVDIQDATVTTSAAATEQYQLNDYTDSTAPNYYGFENADGGWYIKKIDDSTTPVLVRYAKGDSSYSTAWTNRASQSYNTYGATF